jgi:putative transposase
MESIKALDELTLADLWAEVPPSEDEFWSHSGLRLRELLKHLMEGALEEEMGVLLGAARYRRTEPRRGYRNGFYERDLATQVGIVKGIRVPRARGLSLDPVAFERYQRRQAEEK